MKGHFIKSLMMSLMYIILMIPILELVSSVPAVEIVKIDVTAGEDLELSCALENTEENVVIWKHASRVLFAGNIRVRHDDRINIFNDKLVIENIDDNDAGYYSCEIENNAGFLQIFPTLVNILVPAEARILQVGSHLTVKEGTSLSLTCAGSGAPLPHIRWVRAGTVLAKGEGEATLIIEYVTRHYMGEIVCEAFNGVGDENIDTVTLDVLYAPEVEMLKPQISFQPKCGIEFQCLVHSSSSPVVTWFHNNLLLHPRDGVTMWSLDNLHVLQIHSCDQQILGHFTCKADSNLGDDSKSVNISEELVENIIVEEVETEEITNNVRRNVDQQKAEPLVSSSNHIQISSGILLFILVLYHL